MESREGRQPVSWEAVEEGSPVSRISCLMLWGGPDVIIIEIKCMINVMRLNHLMGHYSFHGGLCMLHGSTAERAFLNLPGGARPEAGPRQGGTGL